jgi:hypothetical protein
MSTALCGPVSGSVTGESQALSLLLWVEEVTPLLPPDVVRQLPSPAAVLGSAGQRLTVSPRGGSLSLWHVGFPCPHALGCLPRAGCVGFLFLGCLWCRKQVGSVGFLLPYSPGSFDVLWLSGRRCACTAALHLPVLQRSYQAAGMSLLPTPGRLYLNLTACS